MTLKDGCDGCRQWLREEAEGLSPEVRQKVLRILEDGHERRCCARLLELRDDGALPLFWNATLDRYWEFCEAGI